MLSLHNYRVYRLYDINYVCVCMYAYVQEADVGCAGRRNIGQHKNFQTLILRDSYFSTTGTSQCKSSYRPTTATWHDVTFQFLMPFLQYPWEIGSAMVAVGRG